MTNICLEKKYTNCGLETIPRPFSKILELRISGSIVQSFIQFVFIGWQVEGYQKMLKLNCRSLAFTSYKAFLKNKKMSRACQLELQSTDVFFSYIIFLYKFYSPASSPVSSNIC